jgi:hypothetical protein
MLVGRALLGGELRFGEIEDGRFHPLAGDPSLSTRSGSRAHATRARS